MDPNELVTITNKKTKEVRSIKRSELAKFGLPSDYVSAIDASVKSIEAGNLTLADVGQDQRQYVSNILTQKGFTPETRAQKQKDADAISKKEDERNKTAPLLKTLIEEYQGLPSDQTGPFKGTLKSKLGFAFPQVSEYEQARSGFAGALKGLVGETGVLTDYDIKRITGILPKASDTPEQSNIAINRLNEIYKEKYGTPLFDNLNPNQPTTGQPQTQPNVSDMTLKQGAGAGIEQILNLLGRSGMPVAPNIGQSILKDYVLPRTNQVSQDLKQNKDVSLDQLLGIGGEAALTLAPGGPGKSLALKTLLGGVAHGATTPGASVEDRAGNATIEGLLSGGAGALPAAKKVVTSNFSKGAIGAQRKAAIDAAKDVKIPTEHIIAAAKKYIQDDPTSKAVGKEILSGLKKKELTVPELMRKIDIWNDAYTAAGKVGKSGEAGVNDALAKKAKEILYKQVPEIAKANEKFVRSYKYGKTAGRFGGQVVGQAAGGAATAYILNKILSGR